MAIGTPISASLAGTSYLAAADAQSYFNSRLNSSVWDDAVEADQEKALIMATRAIDQLNFIGCKSESTQLLEFPRNNETTVPDAILVAACEIAIVLLDGFDIELELENLTSTSKKYAAVSDTYDRSIAVEHLKAGIPSQIAWIYLKPYLVDPNYLNLSRVN